MITNIMSSPATDNIPAAEKNTSKSMTSLHNPLTVKRKRDLPAWMHTAKKVKSKDSATSGDLETISERSRVFPIMKFPGKIHYSYISNECSLMCENIRDSGVDIVGFDMEWTVTYDARPQKTALVQVCDSSQSVYLFHLAAFTGLPAGIKLLLNDASILKVGVNIEGDMWKLERDFNFPVSDVIRSSVRDLSKMANGVLKSAQQWSLDGLCRHLFHQRLDKNPDVRCGRWCKWPLSKEQERYAAADAFTSYMCYIELVTREKKQKTV